MLDDASVLNLLVKVQAKRARQQREKAGTERGKRDPSEGAKLLADLSAALTETAPRAVRNILSYAEPTGVSEPGDTGVLSYLVKAQAKKAERERLAAEVREEARAARSKRDPAEGAKLLADLTDALTQAAEVAPRAAELEVEVTRLQGELQSLQKRSNDEAKQRATVAELASHGGPTKIQVVRDGAGRIKVLVADCPTGQTQLELVRGPNDLVRSIVELPEREPRLNIVRDANGRISTVECVEA